MRAIERTGTGVAALAGKSLTYEVAGRSLLDHVNIEVESGSSVAITGPSGSGKTTLLMCLAGILPVASGEVWVAGQHLSASNARVRAAVRLAHVGVVYQFGELLPELSPRDNVALPLLLASEPARRAYARAAEVLAELDLGYLSDAPTDTLSGGERQRVALARAVVTRPGLVLADEPTGSLDSAAAEVVTDLLFALPERYSCGLVVVTHNERVAACADQRFRLAGGDLVGVNA